MAGKPIELTPSAYGNPLLIRSLFRTAMDLASDQEIVHAGQSGTPTASLASGCTGLPPPSPISAWSPGRPLQ